VEFFIYGIGFGILMLVGVLLFQFNKILFFQVPMEMVETGTAGSQITPVNS
jgi:hypothetical protein